MSDVLEWATGHGGKRQRAAAHAMLAARSSAPANTYSHLVTDLLEAWALKTMSAVQVQKLASSAFKDGLSHPEIYKLASIGTSGRYPSHCNHDILTKFHLDELDPPPVDIVQVPVLDAKAEVDTVIWVDAAVRWPQKL